MMDIIGLAGGPVRPPLLNITDDEIAELRTMLEGWQSIL
jgi:dihydrodipicolinate synthase/N-acetylneuraminate lyase